MRSIFYTLTFAGCFIAAPASAQSLTGNVGSASITGGERSVEFRTGFDDEGNAAGRLHYDYGLNDWFQVRVIGTFRQPDGQDWNFSGLTFENWFQWSEEAEDNSGFNGGLRLSYGFSDGPGPDEIETRLTLTDKFADVWEWRANILAEVEAGEGSEGGVAFETRAQITRAISLNAFGSEDWRLGLEAFSEYGNTRDIPDFEDQAHQIGPVLKVEWDNGVYLQTAVRSGVTRGADDTMFKLFVGREF